MSSLHQDHLLVEGSEPASGASAFAPARGTIRRSTQEKATGKVPAQRQGNAKRTGSTTTTSSASASRPARTPASAAGAPAARAKAGTTKGAGSATAKAPTSRTATAARDAAAAKVAKSSASARGTELRTAATAKAAATAKKTPSTAKPVVAAKPGTAAKATPAARSTSAAKPATAKSDPAVTAAPAAKATAPTKPKAAAPAKPKAAGPAKPKRTAAGDGSPEEKTAVARPTPYKRDATAEPVAPVVDVSSAPQSGEELATEFLAAEVVAAVAEGRRSRFLPRRPPSARRRPSLYLAAALVGAASVSAFSSGDPVANANDTMTHSVSVAEELGITAQPADSAMDTQAAERLGALAVSRNERDAQQAAAAQAQVAADQAAAAAAAEAARPKAVLPVNGARLTSTFGTRWGTLHAGIDLAAPMRTPEMAAMDGVVLEAGPASGFGLAVYIQHENGDVTVYGHMDEILVQPGQVVKAGDTIALLGNRGQSTGPHLHFEVHVGGLNGEKIDPLPWLRERGVAI